MKYAILIATPLAHIDNFVWFQVENHSHINAIAQKVPERLHTNRFTSKAFCTDAACLHIQEQEFFLWPEISISKKQPEATSSSWVAS